MTDMRTLMKKIETGQMKKSLNDWLALEGVTQKEFAAKAWLSPAAVNRYVKRGVTPNLYSALCMAQALDITVEQLINGPEDEKHAKD